MKEENHNKSWNKRTGTKKKKEHKSLLKNGMIIEPE